MTSEVLLPTLSFHDDEVTQSYFARIGHFHAGVDVGRFCRYTALALIDFRDGTDGFLSDVAAISGLGPECLGWNTLRRLPDDQFLLRGETLDVTLLRRTTVRICLQCLEEDMVLSRDLGQGACRLRWSWLLRPVICCPVHSTVLVECPEPDAVKAFDLTLLRTRNEDLLRATGPALVHLPGALQTYVVNRLADRRDAAPWLDGQSLAQAVKTCEMLGALIVDGPSVEVSSYTDIDWANAGNIGFSICARGAEAIAEALTTIRQSSGRRSGRTGPQAVFGFFYRWVKYSASTGATGPIRDLLRGVILTSFAIAPGESVLGELVDRRHVHSVNSLKAMTGLNPLRLYRLMLKAGMIPVDTDDEALNQWVFPAELGEQLIARILNSVPQNQLKGLLGCSKTQAEQLAAAKLVTSVVPVEEGQVGLSVGTYNRDEMRVFLEAVRAQAVPCSDEAEGFLDLTKISKGRSSTVEVIRWQLDGKLKHTRLIGEELRLDRLRFSLEEVRSMVNARSRTDLHRLTVAAIMLGVDLEVVKRLVTTESGAPLLKLASNLECQGLRGKAYISTAEIERFQMNYLTLRSAAKALGIPPSAARAIFDINLRPVRNPTLLGVRLYRRRDVEDFLARRRVGVGIVDDLHEATPEGAKTAAVSDEIVKSVDFGETDASPR